MLIDIIFAFLMLLAVIKGLRKGLIMAIFTVIAFIAGLAAALKLSAVVAVKLSESVDVSSRWLPVIAFVIVFLAVAMLVNLGGRLIEKTFQLAMIGWLNRLGGLVLYVLLYSIVYSIFLFYAVQLHLLKPDTVADSETYPFLNPLGPKVMNTIGSVIPFFKDLFAQLQEFFSGISNKITH